MKALFIPLFFAIAVGIAACTGAMKPKAELDYKPEHKEMFVTHEVVIMVCKDQTNAEAIVDMHIKRGFEEAGMLATMLMTLPDGEGHVSCGVVQADLIGSKVLRHDMLQFPGGKKDVYVVSLSDGHTEIFGLVVIGPEDEEQVNGVAI